MNNVRWASALVFAAVVAVAPPAAGQLKVAVVDSTEAIRLSEEAKAFLAQVQADMEPESADLRALRDEIIALEQKITDEGDVMSDEEKRNAAKDIENKRIDLDFGAKKLEKALQDKQAELLETISPKVRAVVNDMVELERFDLVFERRNVGYVNPKHDITAKVTEKLNERYAEDS